MILSKTLTGLGSGKAYREAKEATDIDHNIVTMAGFSLPAPITRYLAPPPPPPPR